MGERVIFMVPHEEYGTPRFTFYDDMVGEHSYLHLQQHPLLHYYDTHLHGCTYEVSLAQQLVDLMLDELHPKLG